MTKSCIEFLKSLGDDITNDLLFVILSDIAGSQGYELRAEQLGAGGINGTYIHFVEVP